jgi:hypothetical protein
MVAQKTYLTDEFQGDVENIDITAREELAGLIIGGNRAARSSHIN